MKTLAKQTAVMTALFVGMTRVVLANEDFAPVVGFPSDPQQQFERTCFQTSQFWTPNGHVCSDVAICYGISKDLPQRIQTWREHGYRIHLMTGVSWGHYQDYLYGRFDGTNHEDEAQTDRGGKKISHGGDVYYMCPGKNYGAFLCVGVQRALDAGVEAIHLEEPEFWVRGGYSEGFKREWRSYYGEDWQPPHSSVDAQWRASKLKYFLYRRALQQVFDYVQDYNRRTGRKVRCYVPTHSLLSYAQIRIVSPESSLGRLNGCNGYIAQVWSDTARAANLYRGVLRERTFEAAFLEYGAMQNLVRATGRTVWYLNDPVGDGVGRDWDYYRGCWESTLVASLFQPDVWQYEVAPWPERAFGGRCPVKDKPQEREPMPPAYATELQTAINALNDMRQPNAEWDCGTQGIGLAVSDSLMFQRGDPAPSDSRLSHVFGLALPFLKRGMPLTPVQLENVTVPGYLDGFRLLLLSYHGQKPLSPDVHAPLADWVRRGGTLVVVDDDSDPYNAVREWWNSDGRDYKTPREHLFERLGLPAAGEPLRPVGKGAVLWLRENPAKIAQSAESEAALIRAVKSAATRSHLPWQETNYLLLRRGPYVIAAGLDESGTQEPKTLTGRFVNLFDPDLRLSESVTLKPSSRLFLLDVDGSKGSGPCVLASACKSLPGKSTDQEFGVVVEGVSGTPAIVLIRAAHAPKSVTLEGKPLQTFSYSDEEGLLRIRFTNESRPQALSVRW